MYTHKYIHIIHTYIYICVCEHVSQYALRPCPFFPVNALTDAPSPNPRPRHLQGGAHDVHQLADPNLAAIPRVAPWRKESEMKTTTLLRICINRHTHVCIYTLHVQVDLLRYLYIHVHIYICNVYIYIQGDGEQEGPNNYP